MRPSKFKPIRIAVFALLSAMVQLAAPSAAHAAPRGKPFQHLRSQPSATVTTPTSPPRPAATVAPVQPPQPATETVVANAWFNDASGAFVFVDMKAEVLNLPSNDPRPAAQRFQQAVQQAVHDLPDMGFSWAAQPAFAKPALQRAVQDALAHSLMTTLEPRAHLRLATLSVAPLVGQGDTPESVVRFMVDRKVNPVHICFLDVEGNCLGADVSVDLSLLAPFSKQLASQTPPGVYTPQKSKQTFIEAALRAAALESRQDGYAWSDMPKEELRRVRAELPALLAKLFSRKLGTAGPAGEVALRGFAIAVEEEPTAIPE